MYENSEQRPRFLNESDEIIAKYANPRINILKGKRERIESKEKLIEDLLLRILFD